jgi:hypothetical protein
MIKILVLANQLAFGADHHWDLLRSTKRCTKRRKPGRSRPFPTHMVQPVLMESMYQRLADRLDMELVVVRRQAGDLLDRRQVPWRNNVTRYVNLEAVRLIENGSAWYCRWLYRSCCILGRHSTYGESDAEEGYSTSTRGKARYMG